MELIKRRSRKLPMMFLVQIYPTKVSGTPSYQSAWSSLHTDMRPKRYESLTEECAQGRGEHAWAMTSACLRGDTADLVDRWTERGSECDEVRFFRLLDAVGAGIDTLVSQIPSCNGLGVPHVVQSPVRHGPTNDAFT